MQKFKVLLIDDDSDYCNNFKTLTSDYFNLEYALDGKTGLETMQRFSPDIIFLDYWLKKRETGLDVLRRIRDIDPQIPVIMVSEKPSVEVAVEAMKLGAYHYCSKYGNVKELLFIVRRELDRLKERLSWEKKLAEKYDPILGDSAAMIQIKAKIKQAAKADSTVLITGETGVGKELVAWEIHKLSHRKDYPFIVVNCSAVPDTLFESELFGHEKGAFTGAIKNRIGYFEMGNHGTLFLDEIGTIPVNLQVKLLHVLEYSNIRRVGGERDIPIDVRVIAATNLNLLEALKKKTFRLDLYYRLNVLNIHVPPLRERKEDILPIANFFYRKYCIQNQKTPRELNRE